jgi:hypothetical protein
MTRIDGQTGPAVPDSGDLNNDKSVTKRELPANPGLPQREILV